MRRRRRKKKKWQWQRGDYSSYKGENRGRIGGTAMEEK